ncbi:SCO2322 family protein [Kitasatospora sp. NPDC049285]|uniref:SCO2322 family protein n=1 Tax=Kitasatospora sp. NPDC049285 TaxID=3157096 RepID=UPI00344A1A31
MTTRQLRPLGPATGSTAQPPVQRGGSRPRPGQAPAVAGHRGRARAVTGRPLPLALVLLLLSLVLGLAAAPAHAAGYRYWSFWKGSPDGWAYQQLGPTANVPADGSVDGWRFVLSPDGGQDTPKPGPAADFAAICAATAPSGGHKRVAVVLDFGTAADAPNGEQPAAPRSACASVPSAASSAEVLAAVAPPLRYDSNGLLCAIAGFPHAGCGEQVSGSSAASGKDGDGGPSLGLIAGGAAVLLLGAGAVWQARRRRTG